MATVAKKSQQKINPDKKTKKPSGNTNMKWLWLAAIFVVTVVVFSSSISKNFVNLDDPAYIRDNPYIKLSWQNVVAIFSTFHNANYHPLTTLVYAIEYNFFKLDAVPYHIVSLLIHLLNVCLVFVLLEKILMMKDDELTRSKKQEARNEKIKPLPFIGALLFAIHPMHVESVAWISELKDVMYSAFFLAGLISYINYINKTKDNGPSQISNLKSQFPTSTFILFLLSLLSKSAAVVFPLLLVLFDYYFSRGWSRKVIFEKIPFFLLSVVFGIVAIFSQQSAGAINADYMVHYDLLQRFFVVSFALVFYIVKLFLPFNLCALYYAPKELPYYYYICPVVLAAIIIWVWKAKTMKQDLIFGFLFYVFSILLVIQIIPVGYSVVSERYSYIPYIGLFFIIGKYYAQFSTAAQKYMRTVLAAFVLLFVVLSYQRGKVWIESVTLFTDIETKNPTSPYAPFGLGKVQNEINDSKGALASFTRSIELDSTIPETYFYRGNVYYGQKNHDLALKDYLKAVQLKPDYVEAFYNVGTVYSVRDSNEAAVKYFSKGIAIRPNEFQYARRGTAYFNLKKYAEAASDYTNALKIDSTVSETWYNLGAAHYNLGKMSQACDDWKKASSLGYDQANEFVRAYCK